MNKMSILLKKSIIRYNKKINKLLSKKALSKKELEDLNELYFMVGTLYDYLEMANR